VANNNFDSNITEKLARVFLEHFDSERVLSKNVDTQMLDGKFDPSTGDRTAFKRRTDFVSKRTPDGDISATTSTPITTGKAFGIVQDYFTEEVDFSEAEQALEMDQEDQLLAPMATRIKTDVELDFAAFMAKNSGLLSGDYGVAISKWDHIAEMGAVMHAHGIPMDGSWCATVNPFTQRSLASDQRSLGAGGPAGSLISDAHRKAIITENFAGLKVMTATTLDSITIAAGADRAGTLASNPDVTYVTHKDTMVQDLAVTGFQANLVVQAGEVIQIAGRNRLNLATRKPIIDETASNVLYTGVVVEGVTLSGAGAGTIKVSGPAIFETGGAYNSVDSAPVSGDVVTLLGSAGDIIQPNLFWHKQAFSIGSVPIKKLYSTDTIATTEDGLQFRISKGTSFRENKQIVRIDFRPAYAVLNPFFAGQGFGITP